MTSVERILSYSNLPQESTTETHTEVGGGWPSGGSISFSNVSLQYGKEDRKVLDSVNFSILAGEKVMISSETDVTVINTTTYRYL